MHGLFGAGGGALGAGREDFFDEGGILLEVNAALLDGSEVLNDGVSDPAFALDAADSGGGAAFVDFAQGFRGRKDFVEVADGAFVGIARIGAADAGGVRDHGL
jgi:hypothetical protein